MEEIQKLLELLVEDVENVSPQEILSEYIVPVLESLAMEVENTQQALQTVAEVSQLSLLTNQRTYLGDLMRQIAENFSVLVLSEEVPKEGPVGEAISQIDALLGSWMEIEQGDLLQDLDDEEDTEEEETDEEETDEEETDEEDTEEEVLRGEILPAEGES